MAARKKATAKRSTAAKRKGKRKVEKVMHEFKHHQLRSGGRRKVTNPKQAIAIALSEARESGANIPDPHGGSRKKSSSGTRKSTAKRKSTSKPSTKKTTRKSGAKKTTSRKRTTANR